MNHRDALIVEELESKKTTEDKEDNIILKDLTCRN
jgi:hypothetical protein